MNFPRLLSSAFALSAPVCFAQLPPSFVQPGKPVPPIPTAPAPAAPSPAAPLTPGTGQPNTLTAEEISQGWKLLFDGRQLIGMKGLQRSDPLSSGWKIKDGELWLPKDVKDMERMTGGDLVTMDFFWDFDFRFEFKMTTSANSGVRYMLAEVFGQVPVGLEYQIIDDIHNSISLKGGKLRRTGALDNIYPVGENAKLRVADPLNKSGDPWNEGRVLVQGSHVEHWLNGEKVLEYELGAQMRRLLETNLRPELEASVHTEVQKAHKGASEQEMHRLVLEGVRRQLEATMARIPATFGMKGRTRLSIVDQGYEVSFRNLKVLTLAPQAIVIPNGSATRPGGAVPNQPTARGR